MSEGLSGRSVLVTGASAGIGKATVDALITGGAHVVATGRRQSALDELVKQHGATAVQTMAGDLNDAGFVAELAARAKDVDILVNNAGILTYAPVMDLTFAETAAMFTTNVLAAFRVMQEIARPMIARRRGHIIVMSSTAAREVYRLGAVYCATKHALSALTRGFRLELQDHGIKVTEIASGMVDTDIRNASPHAAVQAALAARKFEPLTPQQVADAVVFAARSAPQCVPDLVELRPLGAA
jgi:NADP-dependent 3-hydroxy acid dehydrogenase YdfG